MDTSDIITADRPPVADETRRLRLREDGILHAWWAPSCVVTVDDARIILDASLLNDGPRRLLLSMTAVAFTSAARRLICNERGVSAVALVGESPVDRVVAAFADKAAHPARFFTSETEAIAWLTGFASAEPSED